MSSPRDPSPLTELARRALPDSGFSAFPGGEFCPASTAWALLALPAQAPPVQGARARLLRAIRSDGSLPVSPLHPDALWPTPLALLALLGLEGPGREPVRRLCAYLLSTSGEHSPRAADEPEGHDTDLRGWSWTREAHSWVEPTALAMLGLTAAGQGGHPRVAEARRLLLDRQLPGGGWNYGNVRVFGTLLRPDPVNTGAALCALQPGARKEAVAHSLEYLQAVAAQTRAPLSLSWTLLALGAWGQGGLAAPRQRLREALLQDFGPDGVLGPLETGALALSCIALASPDGLAAHLERRGGSRAA